MGCGAGVCPLRTPKFGYSLDFREALKIVPTDTKMMNINIRTVSSIHEIDPNTWDQLSAGRPFQSHRWYAFGEQVMEDCPPTYLLVYAKDELIARASFWLVRNEPLPDLPPVLRNLAMGLLKRWPLFICRSPLANATGLLIPEGPERTKILSALAQASITEASSKRASFVVFDYLSEEETHHWPAGFSPVSVSDPGTVMQNRWNNLDAFLADGNKKDRQHYKRTLREAEKLGIRLDEYKQVPDVEAALSLIRNVDKQYRNAPNPWMRGLLENLSLVDGTWFEARVEERLVGGGLILEDNAAQMTTALGLAEDVPYVYFMLIYASLALAFEKKVRLLRWGSGAYEMKQRLGFSKTNDNFVMVSGTNPVAHALAKLFS